MCSSSSPDLREYCARRGWTISGEYVDRGWSGTSANRPELEKLKADAGRRRFDAVLVWKPDRFDRSMVDLQQNIQLLKANGIRWLADTCIMGYGY